ncbi:MAG: hypothetical protein KAW17_00545 [Candidatus Eisenbacteria sp.]|nr:hypothetical protein [Candidatus Eisenbacteria bacterium]
MRKWSRVYVDTRVIAVGDVDSKATLTFQCLAVEWRRPYAFRKHMYIMRDMVPDANGESFTISQGDAVDFQRVWWMDPVRSGRSTLPLVSRLLTMPLIRRL